MISSASGMASAIALSQFASLSQASGRIGQVPQIIGAPPKKVKAGRNDPCPCGSGRKFKKCHLAMQNGSYVRDPSKLPQQKDLADADVQTVATTTAPPSTKNATAMAMLNAGVAERIVWAYLETGIYMTTANRHIHPEASVVRWEAALAEYDAATPADRQIMMAPAVED